MGALLALVVALAQGGMAGSTSAASAGSPKEKKSKITQAEREAAAERAKKKGLMVPELTTAAGAAAAQMLDPAATPHYFGPFSNYANSPLRMPDAVVDITGDGTGATAAAEVDLGSGAITGITLLEGGAGYTTAPSVTISSIGSGTVAGTGSGAGATASISGAVDGVALAAGGSGYVEPVTVEFVGGGGSGATATAAVTPAKFVSGIVVTNGGSGYTAATVTITGDGTGATAEATVDAATGTVSGITVTNAGSGYATATVEILGDGTGATADAVLDTTSGPITSLTLTSGGSGYSSAPTISLSSGSGSGAAAIATIKGSVTSLNLVDGGSGYVTKGIRKFVNTLPGLGEAGANDLEQYMPVAAPDTTTYPGTDYYEIAVVQYQEKLHSDLPLTTLRGYVQLSTDVVPGKRIPLTYPDGTAIMLPGGAPALAVDKPHYLGPVISAQRDEPVRILFRNLLPTGVAGDLFIPVDHTVMGAGMGPNGSDHFTENRATLHLHGGRTPWISDGTPHQWITPAGENTPYPQGVSVYDVPDMADPGPGAQTFFYTNQQSARLMFYHDHAWGITRLNVYAGEAAGYLINDPVEKDLVDRGLIPAEQLPLVIQDKTFVPDTYQLAMEDPTWDGTKWGALGDLWVPHVYMPAQNPEDPTGMNAFGRWHYGPWFWPPTQGIKVGPQPNPYYDPVNAPWEPTEIPGTPTPSMGMEAFNDTPLVNGTAYPTLTVDPKAYRLRILNAANDRFWNLQLYQADGSIVTGDGRANTEVKMVPAVTTPGFPELWPTDNREGGVPDPATAGPEWIYLGSEGGFLPEPVTVAQQPITWNLDPTTFNFGNVQDHSLLLAPAERADVVVDFSQYAGKTLILYNDAPAAFPALDPRYDYYTGAPDMTDTGGAPTPIAGFGPNTRTIMQIKVAAAPAAASFDFAALRTAWLPSPGSSGPGADGVFARDQDPIIVGQSEYNAAYNANFSARPPYNGVSRIFDTSLSFKTLWGQTLTIPMEPKAIQDEMGEAFDREYGRMSGNLGITLPGTVPGFNLFPFINPPTEKLKFNVEPLSPILQDGTQIWKITHNGVDTHPIHFHAYEVQLINRVGWDNGMRRPHPTELGWKETLRISPLEDTIVAMRPIIGKLPFGVPDSSRRYDPSAPLGSTVGFNSTDPLTGNPIVPPIQNQTFNYGWEYVVHCHILSHEEMDMMRPVVLLADRKLADPGVIEYTRDGGTTLIWTDGTPIDPLDLATWGDPRNEVGYRIERAPIAGKVGDYVQVGTARANATMFVDATADPAKWYAYRVIAWNAAGTSMPKEAIVGPAGVAVPAAPTNATARLELGPRIRVEWMDNALDETGFVVERSTNGGQYVPIGTPPSQRSTGAVSYVDTTVKANTTHQYRVEAVNGGGSSAYAYTSSVNVPAVPAAPSNLTGTVVIRTANSDTVTLTWTDNSATELGFTIERSTTADFATVTKASVGANVTTFVQSTARNRTYYYRVQAFNIGGGSAWSNAFSLTTP